MERVALILKETVALAGSPLTVFIALGEKAEEASIPILRGWREKGIKVMEEFSPGSLKSRMKRADRLGARYTVIMGDDELAKGEVAVKDMLTSAQERLSFDAL